MKDKIEYYYNMKIDLFKEYEDYYSFICDNMKFYFVPYYKDEKNLELLNDIVISQNSRELLFHNIVFTKDGKACVDVNGINYVLLCLSTVENMEISLNDMIQYNDHHRLSNNVVSKYINNWEELWSQKNDYFEYQVSELGKGKEIILNSFSYYIGLAENAIMYVNEVNSKYKLSEVDRVCLCHTRMTYPNIALNFYNPLNFMVDLEVRDIALYLSSSFFKGINPLDEFNELLNKYMLTDYSASMLYARLLYPSYYFDIYAKVIEDKLDENRLLDIIDMAHEYEYFLVDVYHILSKKNNIPKVEWLFNL